MVVKQGFAWDYALPALEMMVSLEELQRRADRPEAFLERLLTEAAGLSVAKSEPELVFVLVKPGFAWEYLLPALEMMVSLEELRRSAGLSEALL